ncbi:MAG: type II toxin-antitoxin system VapC family toxin [Gammaproteobacteria bacterium]|nr:type II toxin-antitoxin system VapC family toxin [Gammaproteobacteria bacterium]
MILADVNILIYAFRSDTERHSEHKSWLEDVLNGPAAYGVSPQVLASLVRICTHRRIFPRPSKASDAFGFCRLLLEQPNATVIVPGERHWEIFADLCRECRVTGNLVQDAWFAALAIEAGCEWITTDRDYARFPGLVARAPF